MNLIASALLGSAIRHVAQIAASALVTSGLLDGNEASTVVGAVGIVGTLIWSQLDGWFKAQKIKTVVKK